MLSANSSGLCLSRPDFSLYSPPLPGLCCFCADPQAQAVWPKGAAEHGAYSVKDVPRPGRLRMEIHQLSRLLVRNEPLQERPACLASAGHTFADSAARPSRRSPPTR